MTDKSEVAGHIGLVYGTCRRCRSTGHICIVTYCTPNVM